VVTALQQQILMLLASKDVDESVTIGQLTSQLLALKGSIMVGLVTVTTPKMLKTDNPYLDRVVKLSCVNGRLNNDYAKAVNRQRVREGAEPSFEAGESWHEPLKINDKFTPFCFHKTSREIYLRIILNNVRSTYLDVRTHQEIADNILRPWLPIKKPYQRQELENPVRFETYKLSSIKAITYNGRTVIVGDSL
jgi:hypothetical protein